MIICKARWLVLLFAVCVTPIVLPCPNLRPVAKLSVGIVGGYLKGLCALESIKLITHFVVKWTNIFLMDCNKYIDELKKTFAIS